MTEPACAGAGTHPAALPAASGPTLFLIPTPLTQDAVSAQPWLAPADQARVAQLRHFVVETPKVARGWLALLLPDVPLRTLDVRALPPPEAEPTDWQSWLAPLRAGYSVGLLSDAGSPAVADPGAGLVAAAHAAGILVRPLAGPSALLLTLMASGLQGQRFAFHGYLPVAAAQRDAAMLALAQRARTHDETQLLIETPYRNQVLLDSLLRVLPADTVLVIGSGIGADNELIRRHTVHEWRTLAPQARQLLRRPTTFVFGFTAASSASSNVRRAPQRKRGVPSKAVR